MYPNTNQKPLFRALRDSYVWQSIIEEAAPEHRHDLVAGWLCLYCGPPTAENPLSNADIVAAFWIEPEEFALVIEEAQIRQATAMISLDTGLSMEDAERLVAD